MEGDHPVIVGMHQGGAWHGHTFIIIRGMVFNQAGKGHHGIPDPYAQFRRVAWSQFIHNYDNNAPGKSLQRFVCDLNPSEINIAYDYLNTRFYQGITQVGDYVEPNPTTTTLHVYNVLTANCAIVTSRALKRSGFIWQEYTTPIGLTSELIRNSRAYQISEIHPNGGRVEPGNRLQRALQYIPGALVNWLMR